VANPRHKGVHRDGSCPGQANPTLGLGKTFNLRQSLAMKLALVLLLVLSAAACEKRSSPPATATTGAMPDTEISVDQLERQLAAGNCQAVDANGGMTRKRLGTIPGAVLLTDYEAFALSELPSNKARELVFYCANEYCGASHEAAKRARVAGHTNVKVLPAGIAGWVKAGKATTKL
jgi:rhodanese-related sulfurtransferase